MGGWGVLLPLGNFTTLLLYRGNWKQKELPLIGDRDHMRSKPAEGSGLAEDVDRACPFSINLSPE